MKKQILIIVVALVVLGGSAALWLKSPNAEPQAGQAITADAPPQPAQPTQPQPSSETANVEPWSPRCATNAETKLEQCEIVQRLMVKETGKRFAEFAIGYATDSNKATRGVVILPLGILLEPGVLMKIDEGSPYKFAFRYCGAGGCVAVIDLPDELISEMKRGNQAVIQFASAKGQAINLPIVLKGFTKAIESLKP